MSESLTLRQYATEQGISLGTAYRRIWEGKVPAKQVLGRWLIEPRKPELKRQDSAEVSR